MPEINTVGFPINAIGGKYLFLQIKWAVCKFIGSCRGVVSQSIERPSKVPVWRNSTVLTWVRITRETFFHLSLTKEAKVISLVLLSPRYKVVGNNHSKNLATPSVDERRSKSEFWDKKNHSMLKASSCC